MFRIRRIVSCAMAIIVATLSIMTGLFGCRIVNAAEVDFTQIFSFEYSKSSNQYNATIIKGYDKYLKSNNITELTIPETYNDGTNGEAPINFGMATVRGDYVSVLKTMTFNSASRVISGGILGNFIALNKVEFLYEGSDFTLGSRILINDAFNELLAEDGEQINWCKTMKEIIIHADTIQLEPDTFAELADDAQIIVENEFVKKKIVATTAKGESPVKAENIKVVSAKTQSEFTITCDDIYTNEEGGFKPKATIKTGDQENAKITYKLYENIDGLDEYTNYGYDASNLPVGTYYIGAIMSSTSEYTLSQSNILEVHAKEIPPVNRTELNTAIEAANKFYEENQYIQANYDKTAWDNVFYRGNALSKAQDILADTENRYSQEKVDEATKNLTDALDALKNAKADNTEAWNQLQEAIKKAEAVIPDKDKYTDESWTLYDLPKRIEEAKALDKNAATSTVKEIERHISLLDGAINGLKLKPIEPIVKPGTPFAYIPKKGSQVKVLSMTAPENLAGATKVRVTFQCADDVSFNEYASIDIDPVIAGTSNYKQVKGTGDYTTGATYSVDVPLSAAIKAGDSIEIIMATFAWDDVKDYVYGVTAIEFLDAADKSLGAYTDKDVYKENLASAIKEAEAINTSTYTAESVEKLTKALEAAKALKEDATAEEMKKAIDDLNDAIKGLEKKDDDVEAREKLTAKIKEAEAIDTSLYTPESVEKLTKALEAAKALKDDASEEEINKVMADIEAAIKGLVKKDNSGGNVTPKPQTPVDETKVIGVAKGKTFAAGSVKYKVSVAATIKGTVKTAGKVTVVGLSSKKKTSVNVKNTVSVSGASYQVTGIASKAFAKAAKLKKATLGSNIKSIPTSAFESCKKLTTVKATGVTKIGSKAFKGCKVLKKLTFGKKKLSSVKKGAFKGCKKTIKVAGGSKKVKKGNVKKLKKSGYKKFK